MDISPFNRDFSRMQVSSLEHGNRKTDFQGDLKKIQAKAKLARLGSIPFSELGKLKAIILDCEQSGQLYTILNCYMQARYNQRL